MAIKLSGAIDKREQGARRVLSSPRPAPGHPPIESAVYLGSRGEVHALTGGEPDGHPLLYLHGFPDHPPTARPFLGELAARGHRVLAPWMPGYAPSRTAGPLNLGATVEDLFELLDAWTPGQAVDVVGHDWGAVHAYLACVVAPERIGRAVTLALPHPLTFLRQMRRVAQLRRSWYMAIFQLPGAHRLFAARDFALIDRLWRRWSPGLALAPQDRAALHACLAASGAGPTRYYRPSAATLGLLRRLTDPLAVPVLRLHGEDDGCVLPPGNDRHRYGNTHAFELIPGLGHFLHLEAPGRLAARIHAWLGA